MSKLRDERNLAIIRRAIRKSPTRPTLATMVRDTGLHIGVIQKLVRNHHLAIAYRAKDTIERHGNEYVGAMLEFHEFCSEREMNFRGAVIAALAAFKKKHHR